MCVCEWPLLSLHLILCFLKIADRYIFQTCFTRPIFSIFCTVNVTKYMRIWFYSENPLICFGRCDEVQIFCCVCHWFLHSLFDRYLWVWNELLDLSVMYSWQACYKLILFLHSFRTIIKVVLMCVCCRCWKKTAWRHWCRRWDSWRKAARRRNPLRKNSSRDSSWWRIRV